MNFPDSNFRYKFMKILFNDEFFMAFQREEVEEVDDVDNKTTTPMLKIVSQ